MKRLAGMIALALMLTVCVGCENGGTTEGGGNGDGDNGASESGSGTGFVMPMESNAV